MAFRPANLKSVVKFNSATSCNFVEDYTKFISDRFEDGRHRPSSKTFAPSSIKCMRKQWFRIRGTEYDVDKAVDLESEWQAQLGTMCHRWLQSALAEMFGDCWIPVEQYLTDIGFASTYKYTAEVDGYETKIELLNPPIKFACDGIVLIDSVYYLIEIKTVEHSVFTELTGVLPKHVDQIDSYGTLLKLSKSLVIYQDRLYGSVKCYEKDITHSDSSRIRTVIDTVLDCVDKTIAPDRLPTGDPECNYCLYKLKCRQWG